MQTTSNTRKWKCLVIKIQIDIIENIVEFQTNLSVNAHLKNQIILAVEF